MTSNKETYTGKQCVDNEEAEKIFTFLEDQMNNFSAQFSGMCRKVIYSIFASSWATIFASKDKDFRAQVRKSVDSPPGMLTEDHHHTVHEERQVCYSSHLRPKSLHL